MVRCNSQKMEENDMTSESIDDWSDFLYSVDRSWSQNPAFAVEGYDSSPVTKLILHLKKSDASGFQTSENMSGKIVEFSHDLFGSDVWRNVSGTYGSPLPFHWLDSKMQFCSAQFNKQDVDLSDVSDKENECDFYGIMDMHLLCEAHNFDENEAICHRQSLETESFAEVQTADEVIEEIEEILQNADKQDEAFDIQIQEQTGIVLGFTSESMSVVEIRDFIALPGHSVMSHPDRMDNERSKALKLMTLAQLNEELSKLEVSVKFLSESLLTELNLRDELQYEKEIQNTFITKILEVQYKQERFQQGSTNKVAGAHFKLGKLTKSLSMSNASELSVPGRFLTTVIPFEKGAVPSLENLQALIKVLEAIKQDSNEVPALITEYILKVLCPASDANSSLNL